MQTCQIGRPGAILQRAEIAIKPVLPTNKQPECAPGGAAVALTVASGLIDHEHVGIREDDETDEDFEASKRKLTAVLDFARKG
jgi:hypothetical protein